MFFNDHSSRGDGDEDERATYEKKALHNNNRVEDDAEGLFNDIFFNGFSRLFFRIFVAADVDTQRKFLNIH